jgi:hypothetical protein
MPLNQVISHFNQWIDILTRYNSVSLTLEDKLLVDYQEEFFIDFKIIDDEADTKPFSIKQQAIFDKLIIEMIKELSEHKDLELDEIVSDLEELGKTHQLLVKNGVMKKFSLILAKIRKKSISLMMHVYDVLELKPGFIGIGVDIKKIVSKIKRNQS